MNLNLSQSREPYRLNPFFPSLFSFPFLFLFFSPFPFLYYFLFFITDSFYFSSLSFFLKNISPFNLGINLGDLPVGTTVPQLKSSESTPDPSQQSVLQEHFITTVPCDAVLNPPCSRGSSLVPEDVSCPGFRHHFLRAPNSPARTTLLQDPSAHVYSVLFLLSLYLPFLYLSLVYISPVCISPSFISPNNNNPLSNNNPPSNPGLSLLYTLSSHPRTAGHATSPGTQLQLIRAAGANLHQIGFT